MTTKRLFLLFAVLAGGMSLIFLLPKVANSQPMGIELALPQLLGEWDGTDEEVTEKERLVLGAETEFSRKVYRNARNDEIHVSIVLGGHDMNTSIHRPERCLPAQGWTIVNTGKVGIRVKVPEPEELKVTRLYNMHPALDKEGRPVVDKEGHPFKVYSLNYYWFVGSSDTTASHITRTLFDLRDRLLKGYNQRWAYVTVAVILRSNNPAETDSKIEAFIQQLVPLVHKASLKYR